MKRRRRYHARLGGRDIAIDLGTANTLVYLRGEGIRVSEPSVVAMDTRSGDVHAVGEEAQRMIGRTPATISAVRPLRHGVITDFETTEAMLRHFIGRVHRSRFAHPRLVMCAPSGITDVERRAAVEGALEKIAFLPFGLLIDQWRWKVFKGEITPADYNQAWWDLRTKYQGIAPGVARTEKDFDPGAKYHIPGNVPYTRYFLAAVLQFQFHRALARTAGCDGPLHRCSIYGNKEAGRKLDAMLQMGLSRPWQDALEALSGQREMDATAIRDYFAPLQKWLDEQNRGKPVGW